MPRRPVAYPLTSFPFSFFRGPTAGRAGAHHGVHPRAAGPVVAGPGQGHLPHPVQGVLRRLPQVQERRGRLHICNRVQLVLPHCPLYPKAIKLHSSRHAPSKTASPDLPPSPCTSVSPQASQSEKKSTLTALPDAVISFRQLRMFGVQAGDLDLFDGDDISKVLERFFPHTAWSCVGRPSTSLSGIWQGGSMSGG